MAILKLFHVLAVILWLGTLLTVTRLLIYQTKEELVVRERLRAMLKRLYLGAEFPAMVVAVVLGLISLFNKDDLNWKAPWLHMKLTFAFFLIVCDLMTGYQILFRKPQQGKGIGLRVLHGLAGLLLIGALIAIYIMKNCQCQPDF